MKKKIFFMFGSKNILLFEKLSVSLPCLFNHAAYEYLFLLCFLPSIND